MWGERENERVVGDSHALEIDTCGGSDSRRATEDRIDRCIYVCIVAADDDRGVIRSVAALLRYC